MADPYIGDIKLFAGNFAPRNWAFCAGQLLSIAQNTALFSILGTTYGGNGTSTFALPDLRGRVSVGMGQGPGLSTIVLGEQAGSNSVTVLNSNMPSHSHSVTVNSDTSNMTTTVTGNYLNGKTESGEPVVSNGSALANATPLTLGQTGGNIPLNTSPPFLGLSYIIALYGIFPSRN